VENDMTYLEWVLGHSLPFEERPVTAKRERLRGRNRLRQGDWNKRPQRTLYAKRAPPGRSSQTGWRPCPTAGGYVIAQRDFCYGHAHLERCGRLVVDSALDAPPDAVRRRR